MTTEAFWKTVGIFTLLIEQEINLVGSILRPGLDFSDSSVENTTPA